MQNPKSIYEKLLHAEKASTMQEIIDRENSKRIRVHMPCKVIAVNDTTVDVEIQGMEDSGFGYYTKFPLLLDLPIIYNNYTSKAYIITPVQVGDTGLVEFLDFNTSNFSSDGNTTNTSDQYPHALNNGSFINGYIPSNRHMQIPQDKPIIVGLHNQTFTLSVNDSGDLVINANSINLNSKGVINIKGSNVNISGTTTIEGIKFKSHVHGNGNEGSDTTGPK